MNKEVYCSEIKGTQLYADKLGVTGTFIFINSMTQYDMNKVKNSTELFLADKDYKQALNKIRKLCNNEKYIFKAEDYSEQGFTEYIEKEDILQIINEAIGDDENGNN